MDVVLPGLGPWEEVRRNPYIWHFGLHAVPGLPERLVAGRQADYFDFFYRAISADLAKITAEARTEYAQAYATESALTAGFNWYRAFETDARGQPTPTQPAVTKRNPCRKVDLRGEGAPGDVDCFWG